MSLAGVSPKMAQSLARHSDINLTMNVYTMLNVSDQVAAVESLPPVPMALQATGINGQSGRRGRSKKVPTVVPRSSESAQYGAVQLAF